MTDIFFVPTVILFALINSSMCLPAVETVSFRCRSTSWIYISMGWIGSEGDYVLRVKQARLKPNLLIESFSVEVLTERQHGHDTGNARKVEELKKWRPWSLATLSAWPYLRLRVPTEHLWVGDSWIETDSKSNYDLSFTCLSREFVGERNTFRLVISGRFPEYTGLGTYGKLVDATVGTCWFDESGSLVRAELGVKRKSNPDWPNENLPFHMTVERETP